MSCQNSWAAVCRPVQSTNQHLRGMDMAHSMECHPKLKKNKHSNSAIKPSIYHFCIAYLICIVKQMLEYNNALLSSGICYAPYVYS